MLHARHHFLADEAALGEIDAGELVHVGLVREGVAIAEIEAAARHAVRDAMRLVGGGVDDLRAEIGGRLRRHVRRQHDAHAQRREPRIGVAQAVFGRADAVPDRHDAEAVGEILDRGLGAQLVEIELLDEGRGERARTIEKEAVARPGFRQDEIDDDLALRGEQGGEARARRRGLVHVGGDQAVEQAPGVVAGDLDDAAVGEKRCFHAKSLARSRGGT